MLVLVTVLIAAAGAVLVQGALRSVDRVDTRTSRMLVATRKAEAFLIDADRAVIHSFVGRDAVLVGPGQRYQDSIKSAAAAVEQVAETAVGETATLQTVDVQLVTYVGLIEQADAAWRAEAAGGHASASPGLGEAYLWYASTTLHQPGGLLDTLRQLGDGAQRTLDARPWWLGLGAVAGYLVAALAWLGFLIAVQVWLTRRFRRVLNPALLAATACTILLCAWTAFDLVSVGHDYDRAERTALQPLVALWQVRSDATDADARTALSILQRSQCPVGAACETTVTGLTAEAAADAAQARTVVGTLPRPLAGSLRPPLTQLLTQVQHTGRAVAGRDVAGAVEATTGDSSFGLVDSVLANRTQSVEDLLAARLRAAQQVPGLQAGVPILTVLIAFLMFLGIRPRLDEYRTWGAAQA